MTTINQLLGLLGNVPQVAGVPDKAAKPLRAAVRKLRETRRRHARALREDERANPVYACEVCGVRVQVPGLCAGCEDIGSNPLPVASWNVSGFAVQIGGVL